MAPYFWSGIIQVSVVWDVKHFSASCWNNIKQVSVVWLQQQQQQQRMVYGADEGSFKYM